MWLTALIGLATLAIGCGDKDDTGGGGDGGAADGGGADGGGADGGTDGGGTDGGTDGGGGDGGTETVEVEVPARSAAWVATGLELAPGGWLEIAATGSATLEPGGDPVGPEGLAGTCGAGCELPDAPRGALLGKLSPIVPSLGDPFLVRDAYAEGAFEPGQLELVVNDDSHDDDDGSYSVTVVYDPPADDCTAGEVAGRWYVALRYPDQEVIHADMILAEDQTMYFSGESALGTWSLTGSTLTFSISFETASAHATLGTGATCGYLAGQYALTFASGGTATGTFSAVWQGPS